MSVLDPGCSAQLACRNEQRDRGGQNEIYIYICIVLLHRCKLCHATLLSAEEVWGKNVSASKKHQVLEAGGWCSL